MTVRVLIADDHPVVRAGVTALLDTDPDIEIVATAATSETLVHPSAAASSLGVAGLLPRSVHSVNRRIALTSCLHLVFRHHLVSVVVYLPGRIPHKGDRQLLTKAVAPLTVRPTQYCGPRRTSSLCEYRYHDIDIRTVLHPPTPEL